MSDKVSSSVEEMLEQLKLRCPYFCPAIFPTTFCPTCLSDLCSSDEQRSSITSIFPSSSDIRFRTEVRFEQRQVVITGVEQVPNELDAMLGSVERTMELLVQGDQEELKVATRRFMELNGSSESSSSDRDVFYAAYHLAYSIKIILSNVPMQVLLSKKKSGSSNLLVLPFAQDVEPKAVMQAIQMGLGTPSKSKTKSSSSSSSSSSKGSSQKKSKSSSGQQQQGGRDEDDSEDEEDEDEDDDEDEQEQALQASNKRKKKRSSKGKKQQGGL